MTSSDRSADTITLPSASTVVAITLSSASTLEPSITARVEPVVITTTPDPATPSVSATPVPPASNRNVSLEVAVNVTSLRAVTLAPPEIPARTVRLVRAAAPAPATATSPPPASVAADPTSVEFSVAVSVTD